MATKKESVSDAKNIKFEDALKRLEEIVVGLEEGQAPLEESLALYEEGISLFRQCSSKLEEAKKKVEILTKSGGGKMKPEPFMTEGAEEALDSDEDVPF